MKSIAISLLMSLILMGCSRDNMPGKESLPDLEQISR
jgi:PBP1b-binding outer membrane lipoprotein LpoB